MEPSRHERCAYIAHLVASCVVGHEVLLCIQDSIISGKDKPASVYEQFLLQRKYFDFPEGTSTSSTAHIAEPQEKLRLTGLVCGDFKDTNSS